MLTHQQIQESMRGVQDWVAQQQTPQTTQTTTKQEQITDIKKKADEIGSRISALKEKVGGSSQIQATDIKPPVGYEPPEPQKTSIMDSYTQSIAGTLEQQRKAIEQEIAKQREDINRKQAEAQAKFDQFTKQMEQTMEKDVQPLLQPFREDLEKAERERLFVEENFKENQQLVGELGTLLTDIQADVQRQKEVTGLSSIRQPRIQKATEEAMARVGVIEAVMSARNNQINTAFTMIDRSIGAINADRQDQLSYYESLLNFYNKQRDEEGNRILNLEKDEKDMINAQMSLLESDYNRSLENAEYIKQLMMDPGTAQIIAQSGVTLNDDPESVNAKFAEYSTRQERVNMDNQMAEQGYRMITPAMVAGKPENQIERRIDSSGQERIYWNPTPATDKYDEILSPAEADRLGVPYGTTKREAFGSTTQGGGYELAGMPISLETARVINGISRREDLTPTEKAKFDNDILSLGLYNKYPQSWFINKVREQIETKNTTGIRSAISLSMAGKEAERLWDEMRSKIGLGDDVSDSSDYRKPTTKFIGDLRKYIEGNEPIKDLEDFIRLSGYDINQPEIKEEMGGYKPVEKEGWWSSPDRLWIKDKEK